MLSRIRHAPCRTTNRSNQVVNDNSRLRETLAVYAHTAWAGWMEYLFRFGTINEDGTFTMQADKVERWQRQMNTPYDQLTEQERNSDRMEADVMIGLIDRFPEAVD